MEYIEKFLTYLIKEKRVSRHTVVAYQTDLEQLADFLEETSIEDASYQNIRAWIVALMEDNITPRSVNRKLSSLRKFYKYLQAQEVLGVNPMVKIKGPKMSKRLPVYVPNKDMEQLDQILRDEPEDWENYRAYIIIMLFYETGIRLSELIHLKSEDVADNQIKVLGKRNKERIIPLRPGMYTMLEKYNKKKTLALDNQKTEYFLTKKNGSKLYEKLVYRIVNNYLSKATGVEKRSPHVLRHTFATHMLNSGADLNALKEILGHANLSATQVYTHNSLSQLKNIYKTAHPRGGV